MTQARCRYHHGDLRNALIIAAAELIERDGTLEFSMAEAAARAGVSAAAPYRHFADKEELLRAVRELAILGLGHAADKTVSQHPPGFSRQHSGDGSYLSGLRAGKTRLLFLMWEDRGDIAERRENVSEEHGGFMIWSIWLALSAKPTATRRPIACILPPRSGRWDMASPRLRRTSSSISSIAPFNPRYCWIRACAPCSPAW